MDPKSAMKEFEKLCPVLELECPRGGESAAECHQRFEGDFNPMHSWRDLAILQCAAERQEQFRRMDELPPLV